MGQVQNIKMESEILLFHMHKNGLLEKQLVFILYSVGFYVRQNL